jgi:hypothetical protein
VKCCHVKISYSFQLQPLSNIIPTQAPFLVDRPMGKPSYQIVSVVKSIDADTQKYTAVIRAPLNTVMQTSWIGYSELQLSKPLSYIELRFFFVNLLSLSKKIFDLYTPEGSIPLLFYPCVSVSLSVTERNRALGMRFRLHIYQFPEFHFYYKYFVIKY